MQSKERPMLYSTDMVVSILEDRKTKTRRMKGLEDVNETPDAWTLVEMGLRKTLKGDTVTSARFESSGAMGWVDCPYGQPGDVVWVRESWANAFYFNGLREECHVIYKANFPEPVEWNWKPSIHMPKVAARLWLQITDIRVERLHNITEEDAISEGVERIGHVWKNYNGKYFVPTTALSSFCTLWVSINGDAYWIANPWVWVISYKVISKTGKPEQIPSGFKTQESLKSSPSGTVQEQVEEAHLLPGNGEGKEVCRG